MKSELKSLPLAEQFPHAVLPPWGVAGLSLKQWMPTGQFRVVMENARFSGEREYFRDLVVSLAQTIRDMPVTGDQDGMGDDAVAYLHYFVGGFDFYITEKDVDGGVMQAFGLISSDCVELGYISITEIIAAGAELDFNFAPTTVGALYTKHTADELAN